MIRYNGKKYYTLKECSYRIKLITNGEIDLNDSQIHRLMLSYKKSDDINYKNIHHQKCYNVETFDYMLYGENNQEFLSRAYNIYMKDFNLNDKEISSKKEKEEEYDDNNYESDMEKYSNYLINNVYQTENINKRVTISEEQLKKIFKIML